MKRTILTQAIPESAIPISPYQLQKDAFHCISYTGYVYRRHYLKGYRYPWYYWKKLDRNTYMDIQARILQGGL